MGTQLNVFGDVYDDAEPCFLPTAEGLVFNRVTRDWLTIDSLAAHMIAVGWVLAPNEIGVPSDEWQAVNRVDGVWDASAIPSIPPGYSAAAAGSGTDTLTITVSGGPSVDESTVTVIDIFVDGVRILTPNAIQILDGQDAAAIAASIAVELEGAQSADTTITLATSVTDNVISVTASGSNDNMFTGTPKITILIPTEPASEPPPPPVIPTVPDEPWDNDTDANAWYDAYLAEFGDGNTIAGWETMTLQEKHDAAQIIVANDV